MPSIAELRALFPNLAKASDETVVGLYAKDYGLDPREAAKELGATYRDPSSRGVLSDTGNALKQGALNIPGTAAGLADLPFAAVGLGRPVTKAADWAAEKTGFAPGRWAQESQQNDMSPEYYRQQQEVQKVWDDPSTGALDVAGAYLKNPRVTGMNIAQSLPQLAVGGAVGRGAAVGARALGLGVREEALAAGAMGPGRASTAGWVAPTAAGIGEGSLSAGAQMSQYDPNLPDQQRNALTSLGVGAGVGLVGAVGGAAARRLGVEDIQIRMAGGQPVDLMADLAKRPLSATGRIAGGGAAEGLLQEAPQSAIEAMGQNYANDRPLTEGMNRQVVEGALAGTAIGGVFNIRTNRSRGQWQRDVDAAQATATNPELPPSDRMAALDFLQHVRENDIPVAQAAEWRQQAGSQLDQQLEARRAEIVEQMAAEQRGRDLAAGNQVSLLTGVAIASPVSVPDINQPSVATQAPPVGTAPQQGSALTRGVAVPNNVSVPDVNAPSVATGEPNGATPAVPDPSGVVGTDPVPAADEATQAPAVGATDVAAAPAPVARLAVGLRYATPQLGRMKLKFSDDLHLAAYIIANDARKSSRDKEYLSFVKKALGVDARTARAYGRQVVAAAKSGTPVDGRITVPSVPFNQGVQNGNDGQVVRTGSAAGQEGQAVPGVQGTNVGSGTQAAQGAGVQAGESEVAAPDPKPLDEARIPKNPNAPKVPGRKPLDAAGVAFVAKAIDQGNRKDPHGAYELLHQALKRWDHAMNRFGTAKGSVQQERWNNELLRAQHGEAGSIDAVIPLLQTIEDEFGTDSVNKVIAAIKTAHERPGVPEASSHIRLAAAWRAYRDGSMGRGTTREVRENLAGQKLDRELVDKGVAVDTPMGAKIAEKGVVKFLEGASWQGFGRDVHAISKALHHIFSSGGVPTPTVVFSKTAHPKGDYITGQYESATHTVTIFPSGNNKLTLLHELLHAATTQFVIDHPKHAAVDALYKTLVTFSKQHTTAYSAFTKDLDKARIGQLDVAVRNVIDGFKNAKTAEQRQDALLEFIAYGMTNQTFQEYMKSMGLEAISDKVVAAQVPAKGREAFPPAKNARLSVWGKFVNALSWIINGTGWSNANATVMNQFLSDTTRLLEAIAPDAALTTVPVTTPVAEKPAPPTKAATAPKKTTAAVAKPAASAPAPVDKGPEELMVGDRVSMKVRVGDVVVDKPGVVTRTVRGFGYGVRMDDEKLPLKEERATRENLTFLSRKGKTLKAEAPRIPLNIGTKVTTDTGEGRVYSSKTDPVGRQLVRVSVNGTLGDWVEAGTLERVPLGPKQAQLPLEEKTRYAQAPAAARKPISTEPLNIPPPPDTPAFQRWFRASKAVRPDGGPLPVYHSPTPGDPADFGVFRHVIDIGGKFPERIQARVPIWFSDSKRYADRHGSPKTTRAFYLSMQNPLDMREMGETATAREIDAFFEKHGVKYPKFDADSEYYDDYEEPVFDLVKGGIYIDGVHRSIVELMEDAGFDGAILSEGDPDTSYVAFRPEQIKSATDNNGDFDAANPHVLYAQAPAFPNAGQGVDTDELPFDMSWVRKPGWLKPVFDSMGYTKLANASGAKLTSMAEAFAKAFPGAAKWVAYVDWAFGLPEALKTAWSNAGAQSHYPNLTANELAEAIKHLPLPEQEKVLSYLDGTPTVIDPKLKQLADDFMNAFDELVDEYMQHVDLTQSQKAALQDKIDAAKFSDLLIYISDPSKTTGHRMSTSPIGKYLGAIEGAAQDTDVIGLAGGAKKRFFVRIEQVPGANGAMQAVIAGFVREDLASSFALPPGEVLDTAVGWFHKGTDPTTKEILFTRNLGFADAKALNAASSHAAAIQNTVEQMNRVVTSARYAEATINLGRTAGLVYDSKDALVKDHPRMADVALTPIGRAVNESYELKAKLRRTDQWIEVPADSGSYGAMAGKIINGSVWAALDDIHHKQPAIDSPAYNNIIRWFKKNKTVWSPGTHMVNVGSNVAWMYLHDIPVSSVADGTKLYYKAKAAPGSMSPKERALWTAFQKSGALIADYSSTELRKVLADASLAALGEKPSSLWGMTQAMTLYEKVKASRMVAYASKADDFAQNMYAAEDNVFRLAAFLSAAATLENEQGSKLTDDQLLEAGRAAATEFLDYSIHARGVNLLKQTVVPFISWPYRALPALLKIAVYKPWKLGGLIGAYALLDSLAAAMSGGDDEDKRKRKALPAYMNQRMFGFGPHMYLEVPGLGTAEKPVYFKLGGFIPLGDLVQDDNRNGFMGQKWFPSQITPNGPLVSTLVGAIGGVDPFTGQKINRDTDSQWDAFKKRAMFLEGQMVPPALDARKVGEKWDRVVNDKTGPLGNEYSKTLEIAQWVGLRVIQTDLAEAADLQRRAVGAITMEYKKELARVTREAKRFPNRDPQDLIDTRNAIKERMQKEIDRVRNTGEE